MIDMSTMDEKDRAIDKLIDEKGELFNELAKAKKKIKRLEDAYEIAKITLKKAQEFTTKIVEDYY